MNSADSDPAYHSNADPDPNPVSKKNADPSGSSTLIEGPDKKLVASTILHRQKNSHRQDKFVFCTMHQKETSQPEPGCQLSFATPLNSVAEPHHFDTDPDPVFQSDADPDLTFHSHADQDPTFQLDEGPNPDQDPTTNFFPYLDPQLLQDDPLRLPPFHFDADLDPDPASQNDADPDPQHCL